ncbi:MAG: EAL domain-containing protein [Rhodobacterales bacterium]|nr:EAL domain-containing protein [Rhodobacterales bacterium]
MSTDPLRAERDRFIAFAFCWADIVLELDADRRIAYAGGVTERVLGLGAKDLVGRPVAELVAEKEHHLLDELIKVAGRRGRIENVAMRFLHGADGHPVTLQLAGYSLPDLRRHYFLALRSGRTPNPNRPGKDLNREAGTGLYDGASFSDMAAAKLSNPANDGRRLTLVNMDALTELDQRLSPVEGARLKQTIGAVLRANSVDGDTAGQITDTRFGLVHGDDVNLDRLQETIAEYTREADPDGKGVDVESSTVGVDTANMSPEDLANGLMVVMNRFRQSSSKFTMRSLSENLGSMIKQAVDSVEGFKRIVEQADFNIAFQPIIDVHTGHPHHYEALARFPNSPDQGAPFRYITFAEETGLICDFDIAMARKAIDWLRRYHADGYRVAVNVSGYSVGVPSFVDALHALLNENTWTRPFLMFEVTESARMDDLHSANAFIRRLRSAGHEVCLDDFGAGAANFQYLSTLEVDVVKLDGEALRTARKGARGRAFVKALSTLCGELGVDIIAEMIDDQEGLNFIKSCGIDYAQGYFFGKPSMDITVFEDRHRKRRSG